ncbi:hypothetical protein GCM10009558_095170 [Virgisporangium aurantiacum]
MTRRHGNRHLTIGLAAVGLLALVIVGVLAFGGGSAVVLVPGVGIVASVAGIVAGSGGRSRPPRARRGVAVVVIVVALVVGVVGVDTLIWRIDFVDLLLGLASVGAAGAMVALGVELRDAARR